MSLSFKPLATSFGLGIGGGVRSLENPIWIAYKLELLDRLEGPNGELKSNLPWHLNITTRDVVKSGLRLKDLQALREWAKSTWWDGDESEFAETMIGYAVHAPATDWEAPFVPPRDEACILAVRHTKEEIEKLIELAASGVSPSRIVIDVSGPEFFLPEYDDMPVRWDFEKSSHLLVTDTNLLFEDVNVRPSTPN